MSSGSRAYKSAADANGFVTELDIQPDLAAVSAIKLLKPSQNQTFITLNASPVSIFNLRFTKFNLNNNNYGYNRTTSGTKVSVEYKVTSAMSYDLSSANNQLTIAYTGVRATAAALSPINVTVTFRRPAGDAGWIELDIFYTYPDECVSGDQHTAWEVELIYPELCFTNAALANYLLLDPVGLEGGFVGMAGEEKVNRMPLQFAAFYKPGATADGVKYLRGVALSATDEQGHAKSLRYRPVKFGRTQARAVSFHLTTPIHLKGGAYVRAANGYTLSGGTSDSGFSGAQMSYRLRAFQVQGVAAGAPVDWQDVADIYRGWLDTHRPSFYTKYIDRYPNGFTNEMRPLTVVSNYALDGQVEPAETDLAKWLELHPILVDDKADMPGNHKDQTGRNESLQEILGRVKQRFGAVDNLKLEAQIWGFEMEGFYQILGAYPPATDVLSGAGRFAKAMAELKDAGIIPSVTTDPLNTNFNRSRFRGHLINGASEQAINEGFPSAVKTQAATNGVATAVNGNDRVFYALDSTDAAAIGSNGIARGVQKRDGFGNWDDRYEGLTRFYNIYGRRLCPTPTVQDFYVNTHVKGRLFPLGFRHVEFMKHNVDFYFCYDKKANHQHLAGQPAAADFDNVIGQGPWYVKRLQQILAAAQDAGQAVAGGEFALVNEFSFVETLVPYIDEYYDYVASSITVYYRDAGSLWLRPAPVFRHVYSRLVSMKMNLADTGPYVHPGYREARYGGDTAAPAPAHMLAEARDSDGSGVKFDGWRGASRTYFDTYFYVASPGLAPSGYAANTQTGENPTDYTYRHGVEEVFNLRSHIFRYGIAAVMGERIYIFCKLFEGFTDYTNAVINMAVRASHMQMAFPQFFRGGRMLGQTSVTAGNKQLWAWRAHNRQFSDVEPLVKALYTSAEINGTSTQKPVPLSIFDFISRGVDKWHVVPYGNYDYDPNQEPDTVAVAGRVTAERIQHMVWQDVNGSVLYAFANVGNTAQGVTFLCGRGLQSATTWKRTDYTFTGADPSGAPVTNGTVNFMQQATVQLAARTCAAVLFEQ